MNHNAFLVQKNTDTREKTGCIHFYFLYELNLRKNNGYSILSTYQWKQKLVEVFSNRNLRDYDTDDLPRFRQFSSVAQSCPTLCDPMNHSTPGLPIHHQLPESTQTHVHWVCDVIQPSHPLLSPSSPALNLFQHQGLFKWVNSSHEVAKVSEFQPQHQSFQWTPRTDLL